MMHKFKLGDKVRVIHNTPKGVIEGIVTKIYSGFQKEEIVEEVESRLFDYWMVAFPLSHYVLENNGRKFFFREDYLVLDNDSLPKRIRAGRKRVGFRSRKNGRTFADVLNGALKQSAPVSNSFLNKSHSARAAGVNLVVDDLLSIVPNCNFTKFGRRVFELAVRLAYSEGTKLITKNYICLSILLIIRDSLEARKEYYGCVADSWLYPAIQYFWEQVRKEVKVVNSPTGFALAEDVAAPLLSLTENHNQVSIRILAHIYNLKRIHVLNGRSNVGVSFNG